MMVDVNVNAYEGQELAYTGEAITSTTKKTNWGVNVWRQWAAKNGETRPLETVSFEQLNKLLCRFYAEICKVYPLFLVSASLSEIEVPCILREERKKQYIPSNIQNTRFGNKNRCCRCLVNRTKQNVSD